MARVFIDGFESGSLDLWDYQAASIQTVASNGGDGVYMCYLGIYSSIYKNLPEANEYYVGYKWYTQTMVNGLSFRSATNATLIRIACDGPGNTIQVYRGSAAIAHGTQTVSGYMWHHLQVRVKISDTAGVVQVRINDNIDVDFSGNTQDGSETNIARVYWSGGGLASVDMLDSVVIDNSEWPGVTVIQALRPSGAGATTQWTPSTGSNYDCVDELPYTDTDYVTVNSNDQIDTYALANLTGFVGTVKCVQVQARAVREGAATPQNLAFVVRTSSTNYASADKVLDTAINSRYAIWTENPNISGAWTESTVNGLEIGIKSRA